MRRLDGFLRCRLVLVVLAGVEASTVSKEESKEKSSSSSDCFCDIMAMCPSFKSSNSRVSRSMASSCSVTVSRMTLLLSSSANSFDCKTMFSAVLRSSSLSSAAPFIEACKELKKRAFSVLGEARVEVVGEWRVDDEEPPWGHSPVLGETRLPPESRLSADLDDQLSEV